MIEDCSIKRKILFTLLCVAANYAGSCLARIFNLPLYLDSNLTIAVTFFCGLPYGLATAVLSNATLFIIDRKMIPFTLCHITTALLAHLVSVIAKKKGEKIEMDSFIWAGILSAVSNAILGTVISDAVFGSNTAENINNSVQAIYLAVPNLTFAVYFSGFLTNFADKLISATLSFWVYKIIKR